ncbi:hypothetical protein [Microbacterium album]|uniref:Aminoglycoside phosphotransferase domain-containing protein n=1 Tax=Microbacterium album TaxID=2053191 RepID=A0A917IC45_9MICO|nr:hypothetical protein [Microbacterium album]GGH37281.1 hypothetical protein GCM10010921_07040 [Microbacterium album]
MSDHPPYVAVRHGADRATLPHRVEADGAVWQAVRAWPAKRPGGRLPVELRSGGRVRGAYAAAGEGVRVLPAGEDPALPGLAATVARGTLVSHRPGRRAVVRTDDGYAKVVRPGRTGGVVDAHRRGAFFRTGFGVAGIRGGDEHVVTYAALPGRDLASLGATCADAEWRTLWAAWAEAWPAVLARRPADGEDWPRHTAEDEGQILRTWARHAAAVEGDRDVDGRALATAADRIGETLAALPARAAVPAHRDLHDQQILWHPEHGLSLIDLDTTALADPALDLGNLAAHVDFAVRQERWPAPRGAIALAAISRAADALHVDSARLEAWRLAARFRIACVHRYRPRWRALADAELALLTDFPQERIPA